MWWPAGWAAYGVSKGQVLWSAGPVHGVQDQQTNTHASRYAATDYACLVYNTLRNLVSSDVN